MKNLNEFFKKYRIRPHDRDLFEMAFTHSSFNSDAKTHHHDYERLEFIGDSVLGFTIASLLFATHGEMLEGELTKARSFLVQTEFLANLARREHFDEFIRFGNSITKESILANNSILEDIFEAVIGAIYIDQGIRFVQHFIENIYGDDIKNFKMEELKDYKSMLQEAMQAEYRESVTYKVIDEKGPPHDRTFFVEVSFNGIVLGKGQGHSKKAAEQNAAKAALEIKAVL